jgi:hypothetical protein
MRDRVRPRANDRHVASNNVQDLRKLVDAGAAQQLPDPRHTPVITLRLNDRLAVVHGLAREEDVDLDERIGMSKQRLRKLP